MTPNELAIDLRFEQAKFWQRVQKTEGCWLWTGGLHPKGYGKFYIAAGVYVTAHRYSFLLHHGPTSLCVCHHCDNPPCVNPDHLFEGTNADNNRDMTEKGRRPKGVKNNAKLDEAKVLEIRRLYAPKNYGFSRLAREFGVHDTTIRRIVLGKKWSYLPMS